MLHRRLEERRMRSARLNAERAWEGGARDVECSPVVRAGAEDQAGRPVERAAFGENGDATLMIENGQAVLDVDGDEEIARVVESDAVDAEEQRIAGENRRRAGRAVVEWHPHDATVVEIAEVEVVLLLVEGDAVDAHW